MAASKYLSQQATALRLIQRKGSKFTLRHFPEAGPTRDRVRGVITNDGHTDYTIDAVAAPVPIVKRGTGGGGEGLMLDRLRTLHIAGSTCPVVPHKDDQILGLEGLNWTIESTSALAPDGILPAVIYTVRIKQ